MRPIFLILYLVLFSIVNQIKAQATAKDNNKELAKLFENYFQESLKLFPFLATQIGDSRYNDLLFAEFTDSYRATLKERFYHYREALKQYRRETLNDNDKISYDIFRTEIEMGLEGLLFKENFIPFNQFFALPLTMGQYGSGDGAQPFKTIKDYENWISRATRFSAWTDSAIVYFRKGMAENYVLPRALVIKMIPQMEAFETTDSSKNVFYGPLKKMPQHFPETDKRRLKDSYIKLIQEQLTPSYKKLANFLKNEYLPKARSTSGMGALLEGSKLYNYRIRLMTTTNKTADELYNTGLSEVKRIQGEMEKVKESGGFNGDLKALFNYIRTDTKFFPFKTVEEVLNSYRAIQQKIDPNLKKMFSRIPKTPFEIRQVEAFRAASASPQYNRASTDGSRPGIFYVPVVDATKTSVDESVFLHEAIPGHHYQVSLQQENENLPSFRRFGGSVAYGEGWGLYAESLGKELGCYTDPFQYLKALGWEIHRAIRLVVDVGLHQKGWTREQAIQYMLSNEPISEQFATVEVERYMALPAQALAYKVGELKIKDLRDKYTGQLGPSFKLSDFHDELLKDGSLPLNILERKMDNWAMKQKK